MQSAKCKVQSEDERQPVCSPFFTLHSALGTLHGEPQVRTLLLATKYQIGLVLLLTAVLSGCGGSSAPDPSPTSGTETVTFHVTDMGKRLALM